MRRWKWIIVSDCAWQLLSVGHCIVTAEDFASRMSDGSQDAARPKSRGTLIVACAKPKTVFIQISTCGDILSILRNYFLRCDRVVSSDSRALWSVVFNSISSNSLYWMACDARLLDHGLQWPAQNESTKSVRDFSLTSRPLR